MDDVCRLKGAKMIWLFMLLWVITMDKSAAVQEKYCTSDHQSGSCKPVSEADVTFLLLGKAGVGKSTTGNTILGRRAFVTSASVDAVTMTTQKECADRFKRHICVIDTPGLFDTRRTNEEVMNEITKWHGHASDIVNAFVLVVEVGRYTEEYQQCENVFREHFGHDIMNNVIVAFTGKEKLDNDDIDIEEFLSYMKPNSALHFLLTQAKKRYIVLGLEKDNNKKTSDMSSAYEDVNAVKRLLEITDTIGKNNKGIYYTKEKMELAQDLHRKAEEDKLSERKGKKEQEIQEILKPTKAKQDEESKRLKEEFEREEDQRRKQIEKLEEEKEMAYKKKKNVEEELRKQRIKLQ